jgi:FtsP/CotA-like multicopper oxidase with cupredoxin domain
MSEQATARRGKKGTMTQKMWRLATVLALAAGSLFAVAVHGSALPAGAPKVGMVCTPGSVAGTTHTFNLETKTGYIETPDGNSVFMWSYDDPTVDNGHFQSPGPVLCATEGQTIQVILTNRLAEPTSVVFPGQQNVTATGGAAGLLTTEAAPNGGTVSYSFTATNPGTYLYQSGSDVAKQVEMGLYGALVIRPTLGANFAYGASATQFDPSREYLALLADIDPFLHHGACRRIARVVRPGEAR